VQAGEVSAPDAPLLLRVGEAARLLGVSRSTMYQLVGSGQVPVVRIG
jgi:excisionase family DNA binding protein